MFCDKKCIGVIIGTPDHDGDDAKEISATHPLFIHRKIVHRDAGYNIRDSIVFVCDDRVPMIQYNTQRRDKCTYWLTHL